MENAKIKKFKCDILSNFQNNVDEQKIDQHHSFHGQFELYFKYVLVVCSEQCDGGLLDRR